MISWHCRYRGRWSLGPSSPSSVVYRDTADRIDLREVQDAARTRDWDTIVSRGKLRHKIYLT